jgi:hypothetical protein
MEVILENGVLALRYEWRGQAIITFHNLSDHRVEVRANLEGVQTLGPIFCNDDNGKGARPRRRSRSIPTASVGFARTASAAERPQAEQAGRSSAGSPL